MSATSHDYESLLWAESSDLASLLDELDDADFDHASLCDGWRVRDVMSHMLLGHTTPMLRMMGLLAKYRFNVPKASRIGSVEYGSAHSPDEIRAAWHGVVDGHVMNGIAKTISKKEGFVDHTIHHQDIRRPLGRSRSIPEDRLIAALDAMPTIGGFVKSKQRMDGLRWTATDVELDLWRRPRGDRTGGGAHPPGEWPAGADRRGQGRRRSDAQGASRRLTRRSALPRCSTGVVGQSMHRYACCTRGAQGGCTRGRSDGTQFRWVQSGGNSGGRSSTQVVSSRGGRRGGERQGDGGSAVVAEHDGVTATWDEDGGGVEVGGGNLVGELHWRPRVELAGGGEPREIARRFCEAGITLDVDVPDVAVCRPLEDFVTPRAGVFTDGEIRGGLGSIISAGHDHVGARCDRVEIGLPREGQRHETVQDLEVSVGEFREHGRDHGEPVGARQRGDQPGTDPTARDDRAIGRGERFGVERA